MMPELLELNYKWKYISSIYTGYSMTRKQPVWEVRELVSSLSTVNHPGSLSPFPTQQ